MSNQFSLRRAIDTDNVALSKLNQRTFRETFIDNFSVPVGKDDLECYFRTSVSPETFVNKISDPEQAIWVVEDNTNGELVAFINVGPCHVLHPDISKGEDGEIYRIYVRHDRQGYGFGRWLMHVALSWLEERFPGRPIWLVVWPDNLKAQNLYKHYNFNIVGNCYYPLGEYNGLNFIMKRESPSS